MRATEHSHVKDFAHDCTLTLDILHKGMKFGYQP